jgi:probable O-glycosylation ligase (exosortase A-associated)
MRDLAFAAFFAVYLPLILRFPHIGAMIWAWLSFVSPDDYLFGFMTSLPLSKIVALLTLIALAIHRDGRKPYLDSIMAAMLGFVVAGLVSATLSLTPLPINWDLFGKVVKIVVLCVVVTSIITTRLRLQALVAAVALGIAFNGVDEGLKVIASGGGHHVLGVVTMGDNNSFAVAMLMCMPMLMYVSQTTISRTTRLLLGVAWVLCGVAVIGTYSRGGFIGMVVLAVGLIALNRNKLRNSVLVAAGAVALLQFAPASWFDRINSLGTADQDGSFLDRVTAWKISTLVALERPLLGGGFHAIQDTTVWRHYVPGLYALDFIPSAPPRPIAMAAHSIYFEVLGDTGFSGLALFLAINLFAVRTCGKIVRMARPHADLAWAAQLAGMLRLSLIVYLVAGAALSFAYFEGLYLIAAIVSVTHRLVGEEVAFRQAQSLQTAADRAELWDDDGLAQPT